MKFSFRVACITAGILATAAIGACSDDFLAPPDGQACTVGTIAPGDSIERRITGASCSVWSDHNFVSTVAESWTLHAKAHTGYVVRVYHRADTNAVDNWRGDVWLYDRNAAGDAEFATGWWDTFGGSNPNGGESEEMLFTTVKDQVLSIRVEASTLADTGAYTIVVEACPAIALRDSVTSHPVEMGEACTLLSGKGGRGGRVAFWTFKGDTLHRPAVTFTRTSGSASFDAWVTGEGLDVGCYSSYCTFASVTNNTGPRVLVPTISLQGYFTAFAVTPIDTAATLTVGVQNAVITAPRPPFTAPARAGRDR